MVISKTLDQIEEKLRIGEGLPYELIGLEEKYVLLVSGFARELTDAERFEEASDVYFLLTILNPGNYFYWLNLGICEQHLKNYEAAVIAYYTCITCGHWRPQPAFYIAQCLYQLREWAASKRFLDLMVNMASPTASTKNLFENAEALSIRLQARLR